MIISCFNIFLLISLGLIEYTLIKSGAIFMAFCIWTYGIFCSIVVNINARKVEGAVSEEAFVDAALGVDCHADTVGSLVGIELSLVGAFGGNVVDHNPI